MRGGATRRSGCAGRARGTSRSCACRRRATARRPAGRAYRAKAPSSRSRSVRRARRARSLAGASLVIHRRAMVEARLSAGAAAGCDAAPVDAVRIGLSLRALRIRRGWRQIGRRNARRRLARHRLEGRTRPPRRRVARSAREGRGNAGGRLDIRIRWRGEQLDRLLDAGHARLVVASSRRGSSRHGLGGRGRGRRSRSGASAARSMSSRSIRRAGSLLAVEVKTVVPDFQAMIAGLDRKARLAPEVAAERGWACDSDQPAARRRGRIDVARPDPRDSTRPSNAALPDRGAAGPDAGSRTRPARFAGLLFVRSATQGDLRSEPPAGSASVDLEQAGAQRSAGAPERSAPANCGRGA